MIRLRTFSKAYGLAGMRVGYAIGNEELIAEFNKVRNHFGLSRLSQIAALAAVQDQAHLNQVQQQVRGSLQRIQQIALDNQLKPLPTAANFLTIDCGRDGDYAFEVMKGLIERGGFCAYAWGVTFEPMYSDYGRIACGVRFPGSFLSRGFEIHLTSN